MEILGRRKAEVFILMVLFTEGDSVVYIPWAVFAFGKPNQSLQIHEGKFVWPGERNVCLENAALSPAPAGPAAWRLREGRVLRAGS